MSSSLAKKHNLRRSRAIKVKSGTVPPKLFDSPPEQKNSDLKVADRIRAFENKEEETKAHSTGDTKVQGKGDTKTQGKEDTKVQGEGNTKAQHKGYTTVQTKGDTKTQSEGQKGSGSDKNIGYCAGTDGSKGLTAGGGWGQKLNNDHKPGGKSFGRTAAYSVEDNVRVVRDTKTWDVGRGDGGGGQTFDFQKQDWRTEQLSPPQLQEAGRLPPPVSPKPNVKRRHRNSNERSKRPGAVEVNTDEFSTKVEVVAKKHPPISPKPSVISGNSGQGPLLPVISPKPKLSSLSTKSDQGTNSKGRLKFVPGSAWANDEGIITRTQSTPTPRDNVLRIQDRLRMKITKDSGYGSSPSVLSEPKGSVVIDTMGSISGLRQAKKVGICRSIENLADEACTVEDVSADDLSQCFDTGGEKDDDSVVNIDDSQHSRETVDGKTGGISQRNDDALGMDSVVYISCIANDDVESSQQSPSEGDGGGRGRDGGGSGAGTLYKKVSRYNQAAAGTSTRPIHSNSGGSRTEWETNSEIYESVHVQEDHDFSDWSEYDDSDEFDEFTDTDDDLDSSTEEVDTELLQERRKERLYCIVEELKDTEITYVRKLQLLVEAKECAENKIKDTSALFQYIDEIYKLHKEDFLPKLKERVKNWEDCKYIGDIIKGFAPFLKMYTDYLKNFDRANGIMDVWLAKSSTFRQKIQQICDKFANRHSWVKLDIKAHMLEPVQRVPRYKLLLADYLKRLPSDADPQEVANVEDALKLVSKAAQHFELTINQKTEFGELLMLDGLIQSPVPILGSDRKLLKQGPIQKYCLRTDKHDPRYLFLFSDILVVCKEYPLKISGPKYKARQVLHVQDMQVAEGSKLDHELTFVVKTKEKIIEFKADSEDTKLDWQKGLWKIIGDRFKEPSRENSLKNNDTEVTEKRKESQRQPLGQVAPLWVKNNEVTMCMVCTNDFSTFLRRHHCRACGCVVCSKCSSHTWKLEFANATDQRVCDSCYQRLMEEIQEGLVHNKQTIRAASKLKKRFRELCLQWGYVQLSSNEGRSWQKVYCEIHEGGMLYVYKASQNPKPEWNADLAGAEVSTELLNDTIVLKVTLDGGKSHLMKGVFKEQTKEELWRWGEAFDKAIKDGGFRHSGIISDGRMMAKSDDTTTQQDLEEVSPDVIRNHHQTGSQSSSLSPADTVYSRTYSSEQTADQKDAEETYDDVYESVNSPFVEEVGEDEADDIYDDVCNDSSFSSDYDDDFVGKIVVNESNC